MAESLDLLKQKIIKILAFLIVVRLAIYIPVPGIDLDIFAQAQTSSSLFGIARNLTGSTFLGIGCLGILPYINSSIIIQLLTPLIPKLERLQKEEGELGRQQINQYTRYLTFIWAIGLSTATAFFIVKPIVFNWSFGLALKVIASLTTGSMLSMWLAELITNEQLGNGSSMIIFINIIGGIPANFTEIRESISNASGLSNILNVSFVLVLYVFIVYIIIAVQAAYKRVAIVSARQLNVNYMEQASRSSELKNSYIPIKLNPGGIMPLVFSTTITTLLLSPLQVALVRFFSTTSVQLTEILTLLSFGLNIILVVFFSSFYALLVLKPNDLAVNLAKMAYNVPGLKQGKETVEHLEQIISRLAFMGGLFLAFLAFFPVILTSLFKINILKNLTSLIILVGVITDVSSQISAYRLSQNYESFKNT